MRNSDPQTSMRGVVDGVEGHVLKAQTPEAMVRAIRTVMQGDTWFSRTVVQKLARPAPTEAPPSAKPALTERELEVLRLVARGYSNAQIAKTLSITERTVRFHVEKILAALSVSNRTEAAALAIQRGWIEPSA